MIYTNVIVIILMNMFTLDNSRIPFFINNFIDLSPRFSY